MRQPASAKSGRYRISPQPAWLLTEQQKKASQLPPFNIDGMRRSIKRFSKRTAQTYDGFHPRHYTMLAREQVEVAVELLRLIELAGVMPSAIQAVLAKLIPKIKAKELTYRSIGPFPSLYRQWSRCRQ